MVSMARRGGCSQANAQALRAMAVSYAFEGDCKKVVKYDGPLHVDQAYQWYQKGHEAGLNEPEEKQKDLWNFHWEHAQARIAARRGNRTEAQKHVEAAKAVLDKGSNPQQAPFFPICWVLSASRVNLAGSIKTGGQRSRGAAGVRLRSYLVAGEVALTVVLVVGAGLLIKSLWRLTQVNPGFQPERILTVRISPSQSFCKQRASCVALYDELLRQVRGISGVSEAAAVNAVPLSTEVPAVVVDLEGHPRKAAETLAPTPWAGATTPDYFRMMRIPLLAGRSFSDADGMKAPGVVLVSASTARRYWPNENPVGKHIKTVWEQQWRTVVGVVADVRQYDLANHTPDWVKGTIYMPYPQAVDLTEEIPATMNLLFRSTADAGRVAQEVRQLAASVNPNVPVGEVRTMDAVVERSTLQSRSIMWLFVAFAGSALILAAIGVYGVVSFSAAQRTYEIGVRVALGATRSSVFGMVLGQRLRLVFTGLAAGVVASLLLTRMLTSLLYGVAATDPITFLAVGVLLIATAALAGYLPARKASRIDPLTALRVD